MSKTELVMMELRESRVDNIEIFLFWICLSFGFGPQSGCLRSQLILFFPMPIFFSVKPVGRFMAPAPGRINRTSLINNGRRVVAAPRWSVCGYEMALINLLSRVSRLRSSDFAGGTTAHSPVGRIRPLAGSDGLIP